MAAMQEASTVGDLMTRDPVVAIEDMSLLDAAEIMDFYRVDGLPVIDWNGDLVGVISQTDLLHARAAEALRNAWQGLTVRHLMTRPAVTVTSACPVDEAAALMEQMRIHRLVVVAADGEPIGILSITDLVHAMAEEGLR
jgi:CBS domain-containing protein